MNGCYVNLHEAFWPDASSLYLILIPPLIQVSAFPPQRVDYYFMKAFSSAISTFESCLGYFEPVAGVCDAQKLLGSQCRLGAHQHPNAEAYDLTLEPDAFAKICIRLILLIYLED
ncbi:hypothetical protein D9758_018561 [Tetrapyrgos nigripes]|uniref:Uncharacterized protein n=1 Tax=Tetrapyrgos nigripes TaxID=182062 RepID=A0A8H5BTG5_9AGAR|nr:hypothetical protein D9758_018561 [Tetrapyrgos nigripes]